MSAIDLAAWALTLSVALACALAVLSGRPDLALGVLFVAASFSLITAPIGDIGVRLEQPAIVAIAALIVVRQPRALIAMLRAARWPAVLAVIVLAANVVPALISAPEPAQSLKVSLWLAISLVGCGVAAFLIVDARDRDPDRFLIWAIVAAACVNTVVAGVQVAAEVWLESDWGLLRGDALLGKAFGLAWEPNLLAINLAAALMFLLDPGTARRFSTRVRIGAIVLISIGIGLALSRGGIVALVAGIAVLAGATLATRGGVAVRSDWRALLGQAVLALVISIGVYSGLVWLAASGVGVRPSDREIVSVAPEATLTPAQPSTAATPTGRPGATPSAASTEVPSATARATIPAGLKAATDTIELRWRNLQVAVSDGLTSPIFGLGPDMFGAHYVEPTCACPAHIPNQLSASFYETGIVGLVSLIALVGLVMVRAWQVRIYAYVASAVVVFVGYQFTDALRFASFWIVFGAAIGLIVLRVGTVAGPFTRPRA